MEDLRSLLMKLSNEQRIQFIHFLQFLKDIEDNEPLQLAFEEKAEKEE